MATLDVAYAKILNVCLSKPILNKDHFLHLKVYEPLVKPFGKSQTIIPLLVKKWVISEDGTQYHFTLRENIPFHSHKFFKPTRSLDASDVKMSLEQGPLFGHVIKQINIKNKLEFTLILKKKNENFLKQLAAFGNGIKSKELYDTINAASANLKKALHLLHLGTGPFILESVSTSAYEFKSFENYFLGQVQFDKLILKYVLRDDKRTNMLEDGLCHIVYNADLKAAHGLPQDQYETQNMKKTKSLYMAFNTRKPVLKDKELQLAMLKSLDLEKWNQNYFYGKAQAKNYTGETMEIKGILRAMKVRKMPAQRLASYKFSSTWCPDCKKIVHHLQEIFSKELGTSVQVERSYLPYSMSERQLARMDMLLTPHEKLSGFDIYKLFEINKILVFNKKVKNFFYFNGQDTDYSMIEISAPGPTVVKP